ncbi:MAG TPA: hypothetical protein VE974_25665 [Thermoanaerobaculia bacterium]|nr:hypothetical protein [Thermoanaerobaculia bacterium]
MQQGESEDQQREGEHERSDLEERTSEIWLPQQAQAELLKLRGRRWIVHDPPNIGQVRAKDAVSTQTPEMPTRMPASTEPHGRHEEIDVEGSALFACKQVQKHGERCPAEERERVFKPVRREFLLSAPRKQGCRWRAHDLHFHGISLKQVLKGVDHELRRNQPVEPADDPVVAHTHPPREIVDAQPERAVARAERSYEKQEECFVPANPLRQHEEDGEVRFDDHEPFRRLCARMPEDQVRLFVEGEVRPMHHRGWG